MPETQKAGDLLYRALYRDATLLHEVDVRWLEDLARKTLAEEGLSERIGQPGIPLADALQDCEFDHEEIETCEGDGSGMRRIGRAIVQWDSHNFRAVEVFHSQESAVRKFDEYRVFYPHEED